MPRTILRILASSAHEAPFILCNLMESHGQVDLVLICEANLTLSHGSRNYIFKKMIETFPVYLRENVHVLEFDMENLFKPFSGDSPSLHYNELVMRNEFAKHVQLEPDDIVIALDADEIVYAESYPTIKRILSRRILNPGALQLNMHQFIFRINYQWKNLDWVAPTAALASKFLRSEVPSWRNTGYRMRVKSGVHFSWVMDIPSMITKIHSYAHRVENMKYANEQTLIEAIERKVYVFEPERKMDIFVHNNFSSPVFPKSISRMAIPVEYLMSPGEVE